MLTGAWLRAGLMALCLAGPVAAQEVAANIVTGPAEGTDSGSERISRPWRPSAA